MCAKAVRKRSLGKDQPLSLSFNDPANIVKSLCHNRIRLEQGADTSGPCGPTALGRGPNILAIRWDVYGQLRYTRFTVVAAHRKKNVRAAQPISGGCKNI